MGKRGGPLWHGLGRETEAMLLMHKSYTDALRQVNHLSEGRSYVEKDSHGEDRTRYACDLCSTMGGSGVVPLAHTTKVVRP